MNQDNLNDLLAKANEKIADPDVIVDVYDMTYVWVSKHQCSITGYSEDEQIGQQLAINTELINDDIHSMASEASNNFNQTNYEHSTDI